MTEKLNPFKMAQQQLDTTAERLGLDEATHELLRWPMMEIHVSLPVKMDDGSTRIFHGFRVQYNIARGPAKGGIRWHPDETIDTVRRFGRLDDLEDIGGGHPPRWRQGWYRLQPQGAFRNGEGAPGPGLYPRHCPYARPQPGCPRPRRVHYPADHGLDARRVRNHRRGMPPRSDHRQAASPWADRRAAPTPPPAAASMSPAKPPWPTASSCKDRVWPSKALATPAKTPHSLVNNCSGSSWWRHPIPVAVFTTPRGIDASTLVDYKRKHGSLQDFPEAEPITNDELLELVVTVLVPAALEDVITRDNAPRLRCRMLCELANGPTTPEADAVLYDKGVVHPSRLSGQRRRGHGVLFRASTKRLQSLLGIAGRASTAGCEYDQSLPSGPQHESTREDGHAAGRLSGGGGSGRRSLQIARLGVKGRTPWM